jgi:hypothetical protein
VAALVVILITNWIWIAMTQISYYSFCKQACQEDGLLEQEILKITMNQGSYSEQIWAKAL